jgi:hypothetical protein
MALKLFVSLVLLSTIPVLAQDTPKSIVLTDKSNVPAKDILKALQKECPNVSITNDVTKSEYTLEATKKTDPKGTEGNSFDLTLFDRDDITVRSTSTSFFGNAVKDVCHAIKTAVIVEVVDTQNLTQSADVRGDTSGGAVATVVNGLTGRRTLTDASTMNVIVNGEHALLDCFEHRKGCITIGPGKYYGELDGDRRSIWVNHEIPLTHKPVRDHYVIAGSW